MKFNLNGNLPLDPLDPRKEKDDFLKPEDNQKIIIDPFGGKQPPKNKKERKKKEKNKNNKEQEEIKSGEDKKSDTIEVISKKVNLDKSSAKEGVIENKKENEAKKEKLEINPVIQISLFVAIPVIFILVILAIFKEPIKEYIKEVQNDTVIDSKFVMMPDVTGYSEDVALELLKREGIKWHIEYMYNKYFDNGTVIKCSVDADNPVERGATIKVYICKDEALSDVPKGKDYFKNIELPTCPISKNSIILTNVELDDVYLNLTFKNNSSKKIIKMKYTLGYTDITGTKFVNRSFLVENLEALPGDIITNRIELTNSQTAKVSLEYIEFTYTDTQ